MSLGIKEIVTLDDFGEVEVNFDYEDGVYSINYVFDKDANELYNWTNIPVWVEKDILSLLESRREKR